MLDQQQYARLARSLPLLQHLDPAQAREFQQAASFIHIPAGRIQRIFDFCFFAPLFGAALSSPKIRSGV